MDISVSCVRGKLGVWFAVDSVHMVPLPMATLMLGSVRSFVLETTILCNVFAGG